MVSTLPRPAPSPRIIARAPVPVPTPRSTPTRTPASASTPARPGLLAYWFVTPAQTRPTRVALAEAGYAGATLLIGGTTIVLARYWFTLTELRAAALLAALAVVFGALGVAIAGGLRNIPVLAAAEGSVRCGVAGAMFALAAGWTAGAIGVYADGHAWFAGTAVGLIVAVAGYLALPTAAGALAVITLGGFAAVSTVDELAPPTPRSVGLTLVGFGVLVGALSMSGLIRQRELGLSAGAFIALAGAQQPVARADSIVWAYALSLVVGLACFAAYRGLAVTLLLPLGVIGMSLGVLEATWTHTSGAIGLAITLVATGTALIAASGVGLQLWHTRGLGRPIRQF